MKTIINLFWVAIILAAGIMTYRLTGPGPFIPMLYTLGVAGFGSCLFYLMVRENKRRDLPAWAAVILVAYLLTEVTRGRIDLPWWKLLVGGLATVYILLLAVASYVIRRSENPRDDEEAAPSLRQKLGHWLSYAALVVVCLFTPDRD